MSQELQIQKVQPEPALSIAQVTSLLPSESEMATMLKMAKVLHEGGLLPDSIKSPQAAFTIILKGRELSIPPMVAFASIHIVNGRPTLAADLMAALVYQAGHYLNVTKSTDTECVVKVRRSNEASEDAYTQTFTIKDAERIPNYQKNPTWKQYPAAMLRARAISAACRVKFPDVIMGMYTPEEMGAQVVIKDGGQEIIIEPALEETTGTTSNRVINAAARFDAKVVDAVPAIPTMGVNQFIDWVTTKLKLGSDAKEAGKFISGQLGWTNLNDRKKHLYEGGNKDPYRTMLHEIVSHFAEADGENFNWVWGEDKGEPVELEDIPFNQGETAAEPVTAEVVPF